MQTKIQKWGNSLALRIPKSFAEETGVVAGSEVSLSVRDGGLVVRAARPRKPKLQDLLRQVNRRNLHREVKTGARVGKEVW
jgi:antitoxin MazE